MSLISFEKMLKDALVGKYAVGYFEAWNQESLEGVLSAAEETSSPVILGFGGIVANPQWFDNQGLEYCAALGRVAAEKSQVPVCLILNEANTYEQCIRGMKLGFNVVMMDTSGLPLHDNIEITRRLAETAHGQGIGVEGELGQLPEAGKDYKSSCTDPEEAFQFVKQTGIDALSVSVGNIHILTKGEALIDFDRLKRIREMTDIPLVIHGGTGFPEKAIGKAIEFGVCKFNVGTILKQSFFCALKKNMAGISEVNDIHGLIGSRKNEDILFQAIVELKEAVKRLMKLYGCAGKAVGEEQ